MNWKSLLCTSVLVGASTLFAEKVELDDKLEKAEAWAMKKGWAMNEDKLTGNCPQKLFLKDKIVFKDVEFKAEVTPVKATADSWKVAGLAISQNDNAFWQLALVEAPDKYAKPKMHFVELKCRKGKVWGAERDLKCLKHKSFKWEYGKTYELKLNMTADKIEGTVEDDDDKILAHFIYALTADAVKGGTPALVSKSMISKFDDIEAEGNK